MDIYCIGRNYREHAKELGNKVPSSPVVFLKASSSLRGIEKSPVAFSDETFHFECELVLKIAKNHSLGESYSKDSIESIACGLDLTRRSAQDELKKSGLPWTISKSFTGSAIIGKFHSVSLFSTLEDISFEFYLNDELKQNGNAKNMIFPIENIVSFINTFSPLKKGDMVFTGTPEGVGEIKKGDQFEMKILGLRHSEKGEL